MTYVPCEGYRPVTSGKYRIENRYYRNIELTIYRIELPIYWSNALSFQPLASPYFLRCYWTKSVDVSTIEIVTIWAFVIDISSIILFVYWYHIDLIFRLSKTYRFYISAIENLSELYSARYPSLPVSPLGTARGTSTLLRPQLQFDLRSKVNIWALVRAVLVLPYLASCLKRGVCVV